MLISHVDQSVVFGDPVKHWEWKTINVRRKHCYYHYDLHVAVVILTKRSICVRTQWLKAI